MSFLRFERQQTIERQQTLFLFVSRKSKHRVPSVWDTTNLWFLWFERAQKWFFFGLRDCRQLRDSRHRFPSVWETTNTSFLRFEKEETNIPFILTASIHSLCSIWKQAHFATCLRVRMRSVRSDSTCAKLPVSEAVHTRFLFEMRWEHTEVLLRSLDEPGTC